MIPYEKVDETVTPDGGLLQLYRRGADFTIQRNGNAIMKSRTHDSEEVLARLGCAPIAGHSAPCVLVGGLGMGYTLAAALKILPKDAVVVVAELLETVVRWNREILGDLAGRPLDDPRVEVHIGDVADLISGSFDRFDALLLDMDNGPDDPMVPSNTGLYKESGLSACRASLRNGGVLAIWSGGSQEGFTRRLSRAGFTAREERCTPHGKRGTRSHTIWLGLAE